MARNEYKERRKQERQAALEAEAQQQEAERAKRWGHMFSLECVSCTYTCNECGAAVLDRSVHFEWHQRFS